MEGERQVPGAGCDTPARYAIAVDFDGVIHQHVSPWIGDPTHIPDPPVPGAIAWLESMVARYDIFIFTCRLLTPKRSPVERAMCAWLAAHGASVDLVHALHFVSEKPHAGVYLDDRAMRFEGRFPGTGEIDAAAVPWNKRTTPSAQELAELVDVLVDAADALRDAVPVGDRVELLNAADAYDTARASLTWGRIKDRRLRPLPDDIGELLR